MGDVIKIMVLMVAAGAAYALGFFGMVKVLESESFRAAWAKADQAVLAAAGWTGERLSRLKAKLASAKTPEDKKAAVAELKSMIETLEKA